MSLPTPPAPAGLAALQQAFGAAVSLPFLFDEDADDVRTRAEDYPQIIVNQMVPRPDKNMSGAQRLAVYNQQYWFRLLTIMQQEFPLVRHLIGVYQLNKLTTTYLTRYPSTSPSLRHLSDRLPHFLNEDPDWGMPVLKQAVELERIYIQAFDAARLPRLDAAALDDAGRAALVQEPLCFQPHWFLFAEDWELVTQRLGILNDEDDQIQIDLQESQGFWVIYRDQSGVTQVALGPIQYQLLLRLSNGASLETACAQVAEACDQEALIFLQTNIQSWFAHWLQLGWFAAEKQE